MAKKEMTLVYYHVPEDRDDPECPNVFGVPYSKNTLKLAHIYEAFPLKGSYLFRFKYNCDGQLVWLDLPDPDAKLPTFRDKVVVKATRVSWNDSKLHSHYREKAATVHVETSNNNPVQVDFFDNTSHKKEEVRSTPTQNRTDFIKERPQPAQQPQKSQNNQSNLLEDMHHPPKNGSQGLAGSSLGMDFLGGSSTIPSAPSAAKKTEINLMHGFDKHDHGDLI